jgi:NAD(P)-dependent dehydrogenase (short-subunit alcohol dehydrogenase family)
MSPVLDLSGRVALVTGGSRGIGAGISRVLVDAGATVVTCARSAVEEPAEGTTHVQCDVRDPEAVGVLVAGVVEQHGRLDVLVNNAGGSPYAPAAEASPRFVEKVLGLNLTAPFLLAQAANAVMQGQESGGVIVNISSVSALRPSPGTSAYGAAKSGVDSLTRSLAVEWGPKVRVNTVDVGLCRTEQTAEHYGGDATVAAIEETIPLGRMAEPVEVGNVVCFLASDLASYVSGASVECHGGGEPPAFQVAQGLHVAQQLAKETP